MRFPSFTRKILWNESSLVVLPFAFFEKLEIANLKLAIHKQRGLDDIVNLAFSLRFYSMRPFQVKEEIFALLKILETHRSKYMLEIGTSWGGTLFLFTQAASPDATIISVDMPGSRFGGAYPKWRTPFYKSFARAYQRICLIRQDSHALSTFRMVKKILGDNSLDFLFIDGDHTYAGAKKDFSMYSKLVRKGGLIALHDICVHPSELGCDVDLLWRELKSQYAHDEIVEDACQGWAGIGLVHRT